METARFTDKHVHLFKETTNNGAETYCGLRERNDIWTDPDSEVTCGRCLRKLTERVNQLGRAVDSIRVGPEGALYPS